MRLLVVWNATLLLRQEDKPPLRIETEKHDPSFWVGVDFDDDVLKLSPAELEARVRTHVLDVVVNLPPEIASVIHKVAEHKQAGLL